MQEVKPTMQARTGAGGGGGVTASYALYTDVPSGQGMVYILSVLSRNLISCESVLIVTKLLSA